LFGACSSRLSNGAFDCLANHDGKIDGVGAVRVESVGATNERTPVDEDSLEIGSGQHSTILGKPFQTFNYRVPT
jgi:hypothetical protein